MSLTFFLSPELVAINVMAFFFDGVYYALSRGVLRRNCKLTSKHYFVAESLSCLH